MGNHQTFSQKVIIKDDYVKKDGTSQIHIYVSIDGKWTRIPLKISWPPSHFDKAAGKLKPRHEKDQDCTDYSMIIVTECSKINEIFKSHRLSGKVLTIDNLEREYYNFKARNCFLRYFDNESRERYKRRKIEKGTYDCNQVALNKLNEFWIKECQKKVKGRREEAPVEPERFPHPLPFNQLTKQLLENFAAFCKNQHGNEPVTISKNLRDIKTYVNRALEDKHVFDNPFKNFKYKAIESLPHAHTEEELQALLKLVNHPVTSDAWRQVLAHYLYSCFTGLRISDIQAVSHDNIQGDWLVIKPYKTRRFNKIVRIPLHPICQTFIHSTTGKLFKTFSEQYTNRILKKIGEYLKFPFDPTTHTARHTFGTLFIELGGDVVTLKDYMGHSNLETTMKYVHISEKRKKEKINVFDKLFCKQENKKDAA
ncbi:site-specific recombinase XerD [Larkinella arboricola]|uniref:Site-specific recombinase XerD n=1 Tax=Larkinella arboricola TaxID=643671 RepID=A0A327WRC7_LARAB|nr:site-specific integrase [Larkinella arboricola]RAJ94193.1 site-specific recombinase XerD [Larkinella arboricola]